MTVTLAIGIPHAAHLPERAESMRRVRDSLTPTLGPGDTYREITDRVPFYEWARQMWDWAASSCATHFLRFDDDVILAPYALEAIRAMVEAQPTAPIGLAAVHPHGPELARQGVRWYRTVGWLPGWGLLVPTEALVAFLPWADAHETELRELTYGGEDFFLGRFFTDRGQDIWHPIPTVVDHDTSLHTTSDDGDHDAHPHRHSTVTWRAYSQEDLCSPDYWRSSGPRVPPIGCKLCWGCQRRTILVGSAETGVGLCGHCLLLFQARAMGLEPR